MKKDRVFNFSAGPSMLPEAVLQKVQKELLNWNELGVSVMEISHRSKEFMELYYEIIENLTKLYQVPENYSILFAHGGATGQFAAVPLNMPAKKKKALYLISGHWSRLAANEAKKYTEVQTLDLVDEQGNFIFALEKLKDIAQEYDYVHYCTNETVNGIEIKEYLETGGVPVVADMSSNILSYPLDINKFAVIYAGVQKNIAPSGLTLMLVRKDLLEQEQAICPTILSWTLAQNFQSMRNTPNTFSLYMCSEVFKYLESLGGMIVIAKRNQEKAQLLYTYLDNSDFYHCDIARAQRSCMNVVFRTATPELDAEFAALANANNLKYLKGHKVVGGLRASIYNALPKVGVEKLLEFMQNFAEQHQA